MIPKMKYMFFSSYTHCTSIPLELRYVNLILNISLCDLVLWLFFIKKNRYTKWVMWIFVASLS